MQNFGVLNQPLKITAKRRIVLGVPNFFPNRPKLREDNLRTKVEPNRTQKIIQHLGGTDQSKIRRQHARIDRKVVGQLSNDLSGESSLPCENFGRR